MTKRFVRAGLAAITLLALSLGAGAPGFAQAPSCKADLAKFCPQAKPGGGAVAACLQQNAAQLSGACKARVAQMKEALKEVQQVCEEDIHFLCDGIDPGGGRIAACLRKWESEVSPKCKASIAAARQQK